MPGPRPWYSGRSSLARWRAWAGARWATSSPRCRRDPSSTARLLVEERQLQVRLRVLEARQANPDQPHRPGLDVRLLQRRAGGAEDRLDVVGRARPAHLAAHQPEVRELELHVDRAGAHAVGLEALGHAICELAEGPLQLAAVADVVFESRLGRDRLGGLAAIHRRAVAALRHPLQHGAADAKRLDQALGLVHGELAHGAHAHRGQPVLGLRPDPGEGADGEAGEKVGLGPGWDQDQPVRLPGAAGDLGHQFRGGRADRGGEPDLGVDLKLDAPRYLLRVGRAVARARRHIEIGLVQADALDQLGRGEPPEDLVYEPAGLAIAGAVGA